MEFEYLGKHFKPYGNFSPKLSVDIIKIVAHDTTICFSKYTNAKAPYSYNDFYSAARLVGCENVDAFLCKENGRVYIPGENELFLLPDNDKESVIIAAPDDMPLQI